MHGPAVHILDEERDMAFLESGRLEFMELSPLCAGDAIVICARCRSAFYERNWRSVGHCACCSHRVTIAFHSSADVLLTAPREQAREHLVHASTQMARRQRQRPAPEEPAPSAPFDWLGFFGSVVGTILFTLLLCALLVGTVCVANGAKDGRSPWQVFQNGGIRNINHYLTGGITADE